MNWTGAAMTAKPVFAEGNFEPTNSRDVPGTGEKFVEAVTHFLQELL